MGVTTRKLAYGTVSLCLAALSIACGVELVQPGALAQNLCSEIPHGCATQNGVPCVSTASGQCGTAFQLIQEMSARCCIPGSGHCTQGDYAGTMAPYFTATATNSWTNCTTMSSQNLPECDDSCITCANVFLFSPDCSGLDQCGSTTLPQCGIASNPCGD